MCDIEIEKANERSSLENKYYKVIESNSAFLWQYATSWEQF